MKGKDAYITINGKKIEPVDSKSIIIPPQDLVCSICGEKKATTWAALACCPDGNEDR